MNPTKSNHIILTVALPTRLSTPCRAEIQRRRVNSMPRRNFVKAGQRFAKGACLIAFSLLSVATVFAQGTAFTYQGRLNDGIALAQGIYDLKFLIYNTPAPGVGDLVAGPITNSAVAVTNGLFTVTIDFGENVFDGGERWLGIAVRTNGVDDFTRLTPRQLLTAAPYALYAPNAGAAVLANSVSAGSITSASLAAGAVTAASIASNSITASQLATGVAAANLAASGQAGVAGGGIILGTDPNATNLLNAGYVKVGTILADGEFGVANWQPRQGGDWSPDRRQYHTAVWSGSEMIIWGGGLSSSSLANGGWRYSPATDSWLPISITNAPASRYMHTAVWLNGKMIVWGGYSAGTYTQTGGSYNPATDSWTTISTNNAPFPRAGHTAVAAGAEMIVWGGINGTNRLSDGARYNPATDTWSLISNNPALAGRSGHTAIWTGSEMIVWGGLTNNYSTGTVNDGGRYNPVANNWTSLTMSNSPEARYNHTAVWTGTEMIVWGGYGANYYVNTGARYNPSNDSWTATTTSNAPAARYSHTAVWTGSEMIIWGGYSGLNTGGRYSPGNDTWSSTRTNSAPIGRYSHTAIWTGTEMIVWGGFSSAWGSAMNSGGRYNPVGNSWTLTVHEDGSPTDRYGHAAVWTGSEMIIAGGIVTDRSSARYNPATDTWTAMSAAADAHGQGCTAVWTGTEMILWGGKGCPSQGYGDRYNPATDTWTRTDDFPASFPRYVTGARMDHSAIWTGSEMIIWGGRDDTTVLGNGFSYNLASNSWSFIGTAPVSSGDPGKWPRFGHTAVWTGSEMLVWGGYTDYDIAACTNAGFRYPGLTVFGGGATAPSARAFHTAVWTGSEMIVWGGQGYDAQRGEVVCDPKGARYSLLLDAWIAMGTNGAPLAAGEFSAGRVRHSAVWTGQEMIVWGGVNDHNRTIDAGGVALNTGGRFNPSTGLWVLTETSGAPSPREEHTAVWTGDLMLVFGGQGSTYPLYAYSLNKTLYLYMRP